MATLVFSGSASLYPAHLGAASRLMSASPGGYDSFVGTSGGAMVAAFLASGKTASDGLGLAEHMLPKDVITPNWGRFFRRRSWGVFTLSKLRKKLIQVLPKTFASMKHRLAVVTTDLNTRSMRVFSCKDTPTASVSDAVVASCSIPGLFPPVFMGGGLLVDGGLTNNLAVDLASVGVVVGVRVVGSGAMTPRPVNTAIDFAAASMETMIQTIEAKRVEDAKPGSKILTVEVPWHPFDFFSVDAEVVRKLYNAGWTAADHAILNGFLR